MLRRIRRLFIVLTAIGYDGLGGGPSLWALSLSTAPTAGACVMGGCTCKLDGLKAGKACCCKANAALLKRFPQLAQDPFFAPPPPAPLAEGAQGLRAKPCGPLDGEYGVSLAPQRPHTQSTVGRLPGLDSLSLAWLSVPATALEFVPSPLERPPQR
jgi:hypothetical protein